MLDRINEIDFVKSYSGIYSFDDKSSINWRRLNGCHFYASDKLFQLAVNVKAEKKKNELSYTNQSPVNSLFFGEIYNYDELVKLIDYENEERTNISYSSLCSLLYQKMGLHFAKRINGLFSLVLRDHHKNLLLLVVDRFGSSRPMYYRLSKNIIFSSHLKDLITYNHIDLNIDKRSLALFLKYSYIPSPHTIIKGVKRLNPGEMLICKGKHFRLERYIDFKADKRTILESDAIKQYRNIVSNAIAKRMTKQESEKIGMFLSGGLDSSANVALASMTGKSSFDTFGVGFEDPDIDERPYARMVAEYFNHPFHDYVFTGDEIEDLPRIIWHLEQPFLENGLLLTYAAFKSINKRADILISGNCADQLFGTGGFAGGKPVIFRYLLDRLNLMYFSKRFQNMMKGSLFYKDNILFQVHMLLKRASDFNNWFSWGFDDNELKNLCKFKISREMLHIFQNNLTAIPNCFESYYDYSVVYQDIEHYACQNVLVKSHRIAEMFDVKGRDPYLDYNVMDFLLSLDVKLKRKGKQIDYLRNKTTSKYLHRLAMNEILPEGIMRKPKQGGCVRLSSCLDNTVRRGLIFQYIRKSDLVRECFDMEYINNFLTQYDMLTAKTIKWYNHRDAQAGKVLSLLTISLWYEIFRNQNKKRTESVGTLDSYIS